MAELKIKDSENGVSGMVVEDDGLVGEMSVLDSPESDILTAAGDKSVKVNGREFHSDNIEVGDLLGDNLRDLLLIDSVNIPDNDEFSVVVIDSDSTKK
jgi:hypothetical protein